MSKKGIVLEKFELEISQWKKLMSWTSIGSFVSLGMLALISEYTALVKAASIFLTFLYIEFGIWVGLHLSKKIYIKYTTKELNQ